MVCLMKSQKIMLQLISGLYLIVGVVYIGLVIANVPMFSDKRTTDTVLGWFIIIISLLMTISSIFGIYSVANENAGHVKVYGVIHLVMMILNIFELIFNFNAIDLLPVLLSFNAVILSFDLAKLFQNGHSRTINSA